MQNRFDQSLSSAGPRKISFDLPRVPRSIPARPFYMVGSFPISMPAMSVEPCQLACFSSSMHSACTSLSAPSLPRCIRRGSSEIIQGRRGFSYASQHMVRLSPVVAPASTSYGRDSCSINLGLCCSAAAHEPESIKRSSSCTAVPFGAQRATTHVWSLKGPRASGLATTGGGPADAAATLAISVRDLALTVTSDRGAGVPVLKGCSLDIPAGQFWMLLGPNGCGKSTLLKAMAGLLPYSSGKIHVRSPRSFVFQNPDHQVVLPTVEADVAFGIGRRRDIPQEEVHKRVLQSLEAVGMADSAQRSVQTLSGGQKQRVAIAGALAESSRTLLLDELTTYLDRGDQIGVLEAVRGVVGGPRAVTALWVTHRLEELRYADGAAYMENGRVVLCGSVLDVKKHIQKRQKELLKYR